MSMKKTVLFISSNDGSDMRINKEVGSLLKKSSVIFVGVGKKQNCFLSDPNLELVLIDGLRKSPITIIRQFLVVLWILLTRRVHSVHVINEPLLLLFWPFLFFKHTVLDIFDSIFLVRNIHPQRLIWLKKLVYWPCDVVLVTDENRKTLMPDFLLKKVKILPNYPNKYLGETGKTESEHLRLLFFGWLGMSRGGSIAKLLVETDARVRVIMAGWFSDNECKLLTNHPQVDYRGIMPQQKALDIAAREADYILCLYEPINLNNINASPNKIYDAIQTKTPVLCNREIKVSELVETLAIGVNLDSYYPTNPQLLIDELFQKKRSFQFNEEITHQYTWESVEPVLLASHRL